MNSIKLNTKLFLIIYVLSFILCSNPSNISRHLAEFTLLDFLEAKDLNFNPDSRWEFKIKYISGSQLPLESVHSTSILYKGTKKKASCRAEDDFVLDCFVNEIGQTVHDLVQLNYQVTNEATIKWSNLNKVYDIPINTTLKYIDSYSLAYNFISSTNRYWDFRVKVEENILPENGIVTIDLFFTSEKIISTCKHRDRVLYCEIDHAKPTSYLIQISPEKESGTVEWENLENNVTIPLAYTARTFNQPYNLELINNQWNYILRTTGTILGGPSSLITIDTKIVSKTGNEYIYLTRCYQLSTITDNIEYECTVFGEHQEISDKVYVSSSIVNDISVNWSNTVKTDQQIVRNAVLSFKKVYDLEYKNRDWTFKISVEDDDYLPEDSLVFVDVRRTNGDIYSLCSFKSHILNCDKLSDSSQTSTYLIQFQSEKKRGSVTWNNVKQKIIPIPLNYQLELNNAYKAYFTDRWNFIIYAKYKGDAPNHSKIVVDIKQNTQETTASCELLRQGYNGLNYYIFCISDLQ